MSDELKPAYLTVTRDESGMGEVWRVTVGDVLIWGHALHIDGPLSPDTYDLLRILEDPLGLVVPDSNITIVTARQNNNPYWVGIVRRGSVSQECGHEHAYEGFARECASRMASALEPR